MILILFLLLLTVGQSKETSVIVKLAQPMFGEEWRNVDVDGHRAAAFCLCADSRGLMWVGTSQGLFLYDGFRAHPVGIDTLRGVQVYAIVEHGNDLLLGTNHGLIIYQCDRGKTDTSLSILSGEEIRCMLAVEDKLLIGSLNGLYRMDMASKKIENLSQGLPHRSVYSLLRDNRGVLYVGTYNGLARYNAATSRPQTVTSPMLSQSGQSAFINCMLEAPDHQTIYIGTGEGLFTYQPAREQWNRVESIGNKVVKSLSLDRDEYLLVGTYDGLLHLTANGTHLFKRDTRKLSSPAGNQIWTVMEDDAGNVWVGHERGLSITSNSHYFRSVKIGSLINTGESNEFLTSLRDSKGNLWFGGTSGVIIQRADGTTRWHHLNGSEATGDICVRSILEDSHGTIWLSTDGGIYRYNAATENFAMFRLLDTTGERVSNWVYAMRQIGEDLWVASYLGGVNRISLTKMAGNGGTVTADFSLTRGKELANDNICSMVADQEGRLWILLYGDENLYCYHTSSQKTDRYNIRQLSGADPTHVCTDSMGRLWCAFKGGSMVFSGKGDPKIIRFPSSRNDESVLAMAPVDGGVWVSTMCNLWNIDGKSLSPTLIPVPQKGFAAILDDQLTNKVMVGGLDEIVEITKIPMEEAQDMGLIKMVLEFSDGQVKRIKNLLDIPDGLSIPYGGSISLLASTLEYSPEFAPHLEYRVVKHGSHDDDGWVVLPEGASIINLTDMSFGNYEIQIKTVSNPLSPAIIPLKVGVPFWLSWWAMLLYCLAIIGIAAVVFWYLRRRAMRGVQEREREEALANVEQKLAFLSVEKHDLETRIEQLLKSSEEMTARMRLEAITDAKPIEAESSLEKQLARIAQVVEENVSSLELNGAFIGEQCGMSEKQLYRTLKKHLGVTPSEYIRNVRLQKAAMLLKQRYFMVSEVAYMVGFSAPSYFSKCFQDYYGVAPSAYLQDEENVDSTANSSDKSI